MSTEYDIFGQGAQPLPDLPAPELVPEDETDDDFDTPYKPVEYIKLPFKEADFPVIMRQHIAMSPLNRKVPIFISDIAPLGAIASRIRLSYPYDLQPHAILIQTIIEAPPSTGKRCFSEVVRQIIDPTLEALDEAQRRDEQEYREKKNARAQNEKIGQAPKTTIRCIPPATSKTVIVKRSDYYKRILGDYLTFWMWAEELAQLGDAGKSAFSNLRTVMRVAYDLGSKFGQDFASDNSYSGNADVCICSMFCATPQDVDEIYNKREIMGGGCSRVILCSLEDEAGSKPSIFRRLTPEEETLVNSALNLMMDDTYDADGTLRPVKLLDTSWLNRHIDRFTDLMCKRIKDMKTQGAQGYHALDAFRKRASVNAFRSTGLIYYLYHIENKMADTKIEGAVHRDEEQIIRLCIKAYKFLCTYCLNSANNRWGKSYEEYYAKQKQGAKIDQRKPVIDQLTDTFTRDQLNVLIEKNGLDTEARFFLSQWKAKGLITKLRKNVYKKEL